MQGNEKWQEMLWQSYIIRHLHGSLTIDFKTQVECVHALQWVGPLSVESKPLRSWLGTLACLSHLSGSSLLPLTPGRVSWKEALVGSGLLDMVHFISHLRKMPRSRCVFHGQYLGIPGILHVDLFSDLLCSWDFQEGEVADRPVCLAQGPAVSDLSLGYTWMLFHINPQRCDPRS